VCFNRGWGFASNGVGPSMVRLDGAVLGRIKDRVARVPSRKFDSRLPKRLQKDPDEYARRMQRSKFFE